MSRFPDKSLAQLNTENLCDVVSIKPTELNIKPLNYKAILEIQPKPTEYVLAPFLPTQGICFIYAGSGVGKTLFTLNASYAIACGGNFLKYAAPKPRKVLYIDGEMAFNEIHQRIMDMVESQGELDFSDNWNLLSHEAVFPEKLPKICTPEGQEFYNKVLTEGKYEVVVFDNISTLSRIDENKSEEWYVIQDWLISLRAKGLAVIVVHHAGKDKNGYRGTSRMLDVADSAISLQHLSSDDFEGDALKSKSFKVEYQKNRGFGGADSLPFEATLCEGKWSFKSIDLSMMDKILDRLKLNMSHNEIAKELCVSRSYTSRMVRKATKMGLIRPD